MMRGSSRIEQVSSSDQASARGGAGGMLHRKLPAPRTWPRPAIPAALAAAVGLVAAATAARMAIDPWVTGAQFATYFLAVLISTFLGGVAVGLVSVVLSALAVWIVILHPTFSFVVSSIGDVYAVGTFLIVAVLMVFIVGTLQAAAHRIAAGRAREAELAALNAALHDKAAELRSREEQLQIMIDSTPAAIAMFDGDMRYIAASRRYIEEYHLQDQDLIGRSQYEIFPDLPQRWRDVYRRCLAGASERADEEQMLRPDGKLDWLRWEVRPWHDGQGRTGGLVLFIEVITARKLAEQILAERESQLRRWKDVFENVNLGVSVVDPRSNTIHFANQTFASLHRMPPQALEGAWLFEMYLPAERQRIADLCDASDRDGYSDFEADRRRSDGSIFPARIHQTSVRREGGKILYRIVTVADISLERELEAERRRSQRLEAIGQLTAGVAHDFNNLLQGISANLELLGDEIQDLPSACQHLSAVLRIADRGANLTRHLLSYTRQQLLRPEPIELARFFGEFQDTLSRILDPRIREEMLVAPGLPPVLVDASHLHTALLNLAINARDAMPAGGDLRIEASPASALATGAPAAEGADRMAVIRVSDTGTGIAPAILAKVCEPFFTTKGLQGTGLGLSMVLGFAKQSGGDLRITSEPGKGTCVELWLPLAATPASEER
jgi:PAS domain S-box-containing protein